MRGKATLIIFSLLMAGLFGWGIQWFLENFEQRTRETRTEVSPQARRNPMLAAERFLSRLGVESESISGRDWLLNPPDEPGLLLVSHLGLSLPTEREEALLDWVRRGGDLVITPGQEWDQELESGGNHLLDELGVRLSIIQPDSEDAGDEDDVESAQEVEPITVSFPGYYQPVEIGFNPSRLLLDANEKAEWGIRGELEENSYHLLQYSLGEGRLTVLSDNRFLTNDAIGNRDHALLLGLLVNGHDRAWLLYSSNMPPLLSLLWRYAPQLVLSVIGLVLLFLWRMTQSSGPRLDSGGAARRNLMEHLGAAADYAWHTDSARRMFEASRSAIDQEWQRRHPILGQLDPKAKCQWIAERTGLAPRAVESALYTDYDGEQEFIKMSAVLQKLATLRGESL